MGLAALVSSWSRDPSTCVGAVIVDGLKRVNAVGFNGFPRGMDDAPELYEDRSVKYTRVVHAEPNAILNAQTSVRGNTMFVTMFPCHECAKLIIQAGIARVVSPAPSTERWDASHRYSCSFFREAGVDVHKYPVPETLRVMYPRTFK